MANEGANYTGSGCNMNDHTLSKAKGVFPSSLGHAKMYQLTPFARTYWLSSFSQLIG